MARSPVTPPHLASPTRRGMEELALEAARLAPPGSTVVDVACGSGEYRLLFPGCRYLGLDMENREMADKRDQRAYYAVADAHFLPVASGVADFVICAYALDRFERPEAALADMARVLRPGGHLFLAVPTKGVKPFDWPLYLGKRAGFYKDIELSGQTNLNYFSPARMKELAHGAGLKIIESHGLGGPFTYPLKLAWLWWRLARYSLKSASVAAYSRLVGAPLSRRFRKKRGISVFPKRKTRFARSREEFARFFAQEQASASFASGVYAELGGLALAADKKLFPKVASEHCHLLKKPA